MKGRGGKIILRIVQKKKKEIFLFEILRSYKFSEKLLYSYFSFILIFDSLFRNDIRLNNINLQ